MKKILFTLIILSFSLGAMAQQSKGEITIHDQKIEKQGDQVVVSFRAEIGKKSVKSGRTTVILPQLKGDDYEWSLPAIVIQKGRARIAEQRHDWAAGELGVAFLPNTIHTRSGVTFHYREAVPYQGWMEGASLVAEGIDMGCCSYAQATPVMILAQNLVLTEPVQIIPEPIVQQPEEAPKTTGEKLAENHPYILPASEFEKIEPGKLFDDDRENSLQVMFAQGKYVIDPNMGANNQSLVDLMVSIKMIENSFDSKVKEVIIAGFASPEGSFEVNDRLAWNRAVAVKELIVEHSAVDSKVVQIYNGSVDWRGLRKLVEQSDMYMKEQVINIIDNTPIWDDAAQKGRFGELMRLDGGRPYKYMYDNFFPRLRNAAYIKIYFEDKVAPTRSKQ